MCPHWAHKCPWQQLARPGPSCMQPEPGLSQPNVLCQGLAGALWMKHSRHIIFLNPPATLWVKEGITAPILQMKELRLRGWSGLNSGLPATTSYYCSMALTPQPGVGFPVLSCQQAKFLEGGGLLGSVWGPPPLGSLKVKLGRAGSLDLLSSPMCSWHVTQGLARNDLSNDLLNGMNKEYCKSLVNLHTCKVLFTEKARWCYDFYVD